MTQLHIHTAASDEYRVPQIMQIIAKHKAETRAPTQLAALHSLLLIADAALSKKPAHKEKEKREEKEVSVATARRGQLS